MIEKTQRHPFPFEILTPFPLFCFIAYYPLIIFFIILSKILELLMPSQLKIEKEPRSPLLPIRDISLSIMRLPHFQERVYT